MLAVTAPCCTVVIKTFRLLFETGCFPTNCWATQACCSNQSTGAGRQSLKGVASTLLTIHACLSSSCGALRINQYILLSLQKRRSSVTKMGGYRYRSVISGAEFTKWFARLDFERFKKGKGGGEKRANLCTSFCSLIEACRQQQDAATAKPTRKASAPRSKVKKRPTTTG